VEERYERTRSFALRDSFSQGESLTLNPTLKESLKERDTYSLKLQGEIQGEPQGEILTLSSFKERVPLSLLRLF
jgi:hypothetical protein